MVARTYLEEGGDPAFFTAERMADLRIVAGVITKLQQPEDGLSWARSGIDGSGVDGRTKFLMDNSEVYRGLRAMAWLEREVSGSPNAGGAYDLAADAVRFGFDGPGGPGGIEGELLEPATGLYRVAKFRDEDQDPTNDPVQNADPNVWFPNGIAHVVWPHLMGVTAPTDQTVAVQLAAVNVLDNGQPRFPWSTQIVDPNNMPWSSMGFASYLAGDVTRAEEQAEFLLDQVLNVGSVTAQDPLTPAYPFLIDDAGWLLQTLTELQAPG